MLGTAPSWGTVILEKLVILQLVEKPPTCCEPEDSLPCSQETATCFSWARLLQSIPLQLISVTSILITISFHLSLGLKGGLFPSHFASKTLYPFQSCLMCHMPSPFYPPWFIYHEKFLCVLTLLIVYLLQFNIKLSFVVTFILSCGMCIESINDTSDLLLTSNQWQTLLS